LNLALVSLASYPKSRLEVDNMKSADTFFGLYNSDSRNVDLKEYLELFADGTQSSRERTLVIFSGKTLEQDNLNILYKLQTENNVAVILVSFFDDISNLKHFSRHLKFYLFFGLYNELVIEQLVDVIKNPIYDRNEFDKTLPSLKDRRCSEKVIVIPLLLRQFEISFWNEIMTATLKSKHHMREIPMVQPFIYWDINNFVDLLNKHNQQNESGIKKGFKKIFFLLFIDKGMLGHAGHFIEEPLKENKQISNSIIILDYSKYAHPFNPFSPRESNFP